jgi:cytochrome b involved in lipid metabolism
MENIYVKIDNHWFDLTKYLDHPGGKRILQKYHLKDATNAFNNIRGHSDGFALHLLEKYEVLDKELLKKLH